ncbi:hypothetical protein [Paenibacillus naphthalenovorans]|uniref:hypothetical protein n=1 Tax=Paenibacillus naphthalenovorans TaxID=162209 RepID=UPI0010F562DB|nr:hypothetical protein [Paenibacillus naphthalenovorans]
MIRVYFNGLLLLPETMNMISGKVGHGLPIPNLHLLINNLHIKFLGPSLNRISQTPNVHPVFFENMIAAASPIDFFTAASQKRPDCNRALPSGH